MSLATLADALSGCRPLIADGHHRYAAYLRMQETAPGGATDRGLAMLVDQNDTPMFLGAIHRVLTGVDLDGLRSAAAGHRRVSGTERGRSPRGARPGHPRRH